MVRQRGNQRGSIAMIIGVPTLVEPDIYFVMFFFAIFVLHCSKNLTIPNAFCCLCALLDFRQNGRVREFNETLG